MAHFDVVFTQRVIYNFSIFNKCVNHIVVTDAVRLVLPVVIDGVPIDAVLPVEYKFPAESEPVLD